jgi:hypothetical protein
VGTVGFEGSVEKVIFFSGLGRGSRVGYENFDEWGKTVVKVVGAQQHGPIVEVSDGGERPRRGDLIGSLVTVNGVRSFEEGVLVQGAEPVVVLGQGRNVSLKVLPHMDTCIHVDRPYVSPVASPKLLS